MDTMAFQQSLLTDPNMQENLLKQYLRMRAVGDFSEAAAKKVFGLGEDPDKALHHRELQLEIIERKKRLGLPVSSDDYQQAVDENKSFYSRVGPSALMSLQKIPGPNSFKPKPPMPFFKIAHAIEDTIPLSANANTGRSFYGKLAASILAL